MRLEFVTRSRLPAAPERVWEHVSTMEGVNYELAPLFRMTHPPGVDRIDESLGELGRPVFRSRVLLFGLIPVDYDDITIVRLDPGRGFLERSPLGTQRLWEHERVIQPDGAGCELVDRVAHDPRVPVAQRAQSALLRRVFHHRHRRLRRRFGGQPA
jgi:ligand-binding SRPBCC domain-containing protein